MAIKIGLLGVGHLGKIHLKLLKQIPELELVGIYDHNPEALAKAAAEYDVKAFDSVDALLAEVEAVDIVTPTITHFDMASRAVKRLKHVFIEKPITANLEEARQLVSLVREAGVKAMVGHVERFNPAFLAIADRKLQPAFIEVHRLAPWTPRAKDVSVVVDVMIHDIELVQYLVGSSIKRISASGTPVVADSADIVNARIEFHNGCVANLTASRISFKTMRRMRIFQPGEYIALDFFEKKAEVFHLEEGAATPESNGLEFELNGKKKHLTLINTPLEPVNSIEMELKLFAQAIINDTEPPVTVEQAYDALHTAFQIEEKIIRAED